MTLNASVQPTVPTFVSCANRSTLSGPTPPPPWALQLISLPPPFPLTDERSCCTSSFCATFTVSWLVVTGAAEFCPAQAESKATEASAAPTVAILIVLANIVVNPPQALAIPVPIKTRSAIPGCVEMGSGSRWQESAREATSHRNAICLGLERVDELQCAPGRTVRRHVRVADLLVPVEVVEQLSHALVAQPFGVGTDLRVRARQPSHALARPH